MKLKGRTATTAGESSAKTKSAERSYSGAAEKGGNGAPQNGKSSTKKRTSMCGEELVKGLKKAIGVDQRIMPVGRSFTLTAHIGSTETAASVVWRDPCNYYSSFSIPASPAVQLDVQGETSADNLARELQSYALLCGQFNYDSNVPAQIRNRIKMFDPTFDETRGSDVSINAATQRRNTQNIEGLQTLREDAFLLRNTTVLTASVVAQDQRPTEGLDVTLEIWNVVPVSYDTLTKYAYMERGISLAG